MAITSSESPHDMSRWVAEKADCVLEETCKIGDILRRNNVTLSELDELEFSQSLRSIIFDAAKLSSFGHENMESWSNEWVDLMLKQGQDRFLEFQKRARGEVPNDKPPQKCPLSVQRVIDLFSEVENSLEIGDKSEARNQILESGRELLKSKFENAKRVGNKLLQLVDDQAVSANLSWDGFIQEVSIIIKTEREKFTQAQEKPKELFG